MFSVNHRAVWAQTDSARRLNYISAMFTLFDFVPLGMIDLPITLSPDFVVSEFFLDGGNQVEDQCMVERSVITGIGVLSPNGVGRNEFREAIRNGRSGVRRVEHLDLSTCDTRIAGFIDDEKLSGLWPDKKAQSRLDRMSLFSLIASEMAVLDSGLVGLAEMPLRKGIMLGTGCGTVETTETAYHRFYALQQSRMKPTTVPRAMYNAAVCQIGIRHGLQRISNTITAACSSSLVALDLADLYIRSGRADVILVGGVDCPIFQAYFHVWDALTALTRDFNDEPTRASRPFTRNRSGIVLSEGCGFLVLESASLAAKRGAHVYAEILSTWQTNDAFDVVAPHLPTQVECMEQAMACSGIAKSQLAHIQAHGTSTRLNDVTETRGIKEVFGPHANEIPVSSVKSMIGHTLGASGILSLIAVVLGMEGNFLVPTINQDEPDPECDLDYVPNVAREQAVPTAMVNAFGFGGTNVSVVVRKA